MLPFRGISWLRAFLLGMTFMFFVAPIEAIAAMKEAVQLFFCKSARGDLIREG
jgi:hypothetical protein